MARRCGGRVGLHRNGRAAVPTGFGSGSPRDQTSYVRLPCVRSPPSSSSVSVSAKWPQYNSHLWEAAEVLGLSPRTVRRWKWKLEHQGMNALLDRRCGVPSPRRVAGTEVEAILTLYRERYSGLTVRHFYDLAVRDHQL